MQFKICRGVLLLLPGIRESVDLYSAASQRVFQFHAVAVGAAPVRFNGMRSRKCRGTQQTAAEACTFLIGPIHEPDSNRGTAAELSVNSAQHFETCKHVQRTIEPTAVGDRIEMPADQQ